MTTTEESIAATPVVSQEQEQKIRKQVEFYFGDHNLPKDKFLQAELAKNPQGWIPLAILLSFNRLKSLSTDPAVIMHALMGSDIVEVCQQSQMVRRIGEIKTGSDMLERSLYVKAFKPEDTLEQVEAFFEAKGVQGIAAIRMRRMRECKTFKGSVFLEFTTQEHLSNALQQLKDDAAVIVKTKSEYFADKNAAGNNNNHSKQQEEEEDVSKTFTRGCLLRVEGVTEAMMHQQVKQAFAQLGSPVSYFEKAEDGSAWIRFQEPKAAEFITAHDAVEIKDDADQPIGKLGNMRVATEEEEATYYEKLSAFLKEKSRNNQRGGKQQRKGKGNQARNQRKRQLEQDDEKEEDSETKQSKVEQAAVEEEQQQ